MTGTGELGHLTKEAEVSRAVQALALAIKSAPEYRAFVEASLAVYGDAALENLLAAMRTHQQALDAGEGDARSHAQALESLQAEVEALPLVQAYRQNERALCRLLRDVDAVISEIIGLDFAANSKRSCCGG